MLLAGESFAGHGEAPAGSVERIVLAASMPEGVVLHAASGLVERGVGELDDVERVGDLDGVGQHRVEHRAIGVGQVERRPLHGGAPVVAAGGEPATRFAAVPAWHNVEELPAAHVDDLRRPVLGAELALPAEQGLVEPERGDGVEAVRVVDQRGAVELDGVHHGAPVTPEIISDLLHTAAVPADLACRPPRRPRGERAPGRCDLRVLLGPRPTTHRALPALLAPHQPRRAAEHRQIHQHDLASVVPPRRPAAARRPPRAGGDRDPQPARPVADPDPGDVGQADQRRAHARRICFQAGAARDSTT